MINSIGIGSRVNIKSIICRLVKPCFNFVCVSMRINAGSAVIAISAASFNSPKSTHAFPRYQRLIFHSHESNASKRSYFIRQTHVTHDVHVSDILRLFGHASRNNSPGGPTPCEFQFARRSSSLFVEVAISKGQRISYAGEENSRLCRGKLARDSSVVASHDDRIAQEASCNEVNG